MSDEKKSADDAAEQVFLPNEHAIKFLGHVIRMKPVPISVARELRRLPERLAKAMKASIAEGATTEQLTEADMAASELYIDTVYRLLQFYKIEIPKTDLEEKVSLSEVKNFVSEQIEVQGEEDFLLAPLRRTTEIFFPTKVEEKTMESQ